MSNLSAGLSIQDAWKEAEAELALADASSQEPASSELQPNQVSDVEQSAVETEDETSLFGDLASETQGEQPDDLDSQLVEVVVNGEHKMVTVREARLGYQRQEDYTKGKQAQAELEEKHKKAITLWEALESDYAGTVQQLMSRAGIRGTVKPTGSDIDIEALVEQKLQEKLASDPRIQAFEQEQALRQIEAIFGEIENKLGVTLAPQDRQIVLETAQAEGSVDLEYVTWKLLQKVQARDAEKRNLELVSTVTGRRSGAEDEPIVTQPQRVNTPLAAWEAALAEENNLR